jgi:uncharacterized protein YecA (UPF0149 family)
MNTEETKIEENKPVSQIDCVQHVPSEEDKLKPPNESVDTTKPKEEPKLTPQEQYILKLQHLSRNVNAISALEGKRFTFKGAKVTPLNSKCPCNSGKKYKKCCGKQG